MTRWSRRAVLPVCLALILVACSGDDTQEVVVSAASSLTDVFLEMEDVWEAENPGYDLIFNFAGSSLLREQILAGAPADVFAPASQSHLSAVAKAGFLDGGSQTFAYNGLVVAVPENNPAGVLSLDDLERDDLLIGLCAAEVPCGELARRTLQLAGIEPNVVTNEPNVRSLLTKIEANELDAGLVYATDMTGADALAISIPDEFNSATDYPIAVLAEAAEGARLFSEFVLSDGGRAILARHGFVTP